MSNFKYGKVCAKHPELKGKRYSNRHCVACCMDGLRKYRAENREKINERRRENYAKDYWFRLKERERGRKYRENMTTEQREVYLAKQRARDYERVYK